MGLDRLTVHVPQQSQLFRFTRATKNEFHGKSLEGTVGDSYDAMAESVMGIFKTELHRNPAVLKDSGQHWMGLDDLEIATCA